MPLYENYCHAIGLHFRWLSPVIVAGGSGARVNGSQARRTIASRLAVVATGALVTAGLPALPADAAGLAKAAGKPVGLEYTIKAVTCVFCEGVRRISSTHRS